MCGWQKGGAAWGQMCAMLSRVRKGYVEQNGREPEHISTLSIHLRALTAPLISPPLTLILVAVRASHDAAAVALAVLPLAIVFVLLWKRYAWPFGRRAKGWHQG